MDELTNTTAASPLNPISLDELAAARDEYFAELDAAEAADREAAARCAPVATQVEAPAPAPTAADRRKAAATEIRAAKAQAKRAGVTPAARRAAAIATIETTIRPEYLAAYGLNLSRGWVGCGIGKPAPIRPLSEIAAAAAA